VLVVGAENGGGVAVENMSWYCRMYSNAAILTGVIEEISAANENMALIWHVPWLSNQWR
jgi:hypothetical protein